MTKRWTLLSLFNRNWANIILDKRAVSFPFFLGHIYYLILEDRYIGGGVLR